MQISSCFRKKIAISATYIDTLFLEKMICNKCKHRHYEKDKKKYFKQCLLFSFLFKLYNYLFLKEN